MYSLHTDTSQMDYAIEHFNMMGRFLLDACVFFMLKPKTTKLIPQPGVELRNKLVFEVHNSMCYKDGTDKNTFLAFF